MESVGGWSQSAGGVVRWLVQPQRLAEYPIGKSVLLTASWLTMHITASVSLLLSIPCFVIGDDRAGRGWACSLAVRRVELLSHDVLRNWTLLLPVAP